MQRAPRPNHRPRPVAAPSIGAATSEIARPSSKAPTTASYLNLWRSRAAWGARECASVGFLAGADPRLLKKRTDATRAFGPRGHLEDVLRTASHFRAPGIVPLVPYGDAELVAQSKFFEAPHLPVKRLSLLGNKALSSLKAEAPKHSFRCHAGGVPGVPCNH